jgi:DNA-binding MarR family transcriptional regulator
MNDATIEDIFENMIHVMPVFHRRLLRMDLGGVANHLTRLHLAIMAVLSAGSVTMSELANTLMMAKPQMTHLVGQLVGLGVVERRPNERDRRIINLAITDNGRVLLENVKRKVQDTIRHRLKSLTPEELSEMSAALKTLGNIADKL